MPYFKDLSELAGRVEVWADLRHEQGLKTGAVLGRLRRELRLALRQLERMRPAAAAQAREPDALDAIRALRPDGPRVLACPTRGRGYLSRLRGAWLGRAAGCTLGAPVEAWSPDDMERLARRCGMEFPPTDYWTGHPTPDRPHYGTNVMGDYLRDGLRAIPVDDDLTYTVLGLLILERYGPDFSTGDVGRAWLDLLPTACTAEEVALENLRRGISAEKAGEVGNPYQEWIGADIRSDPWAYAAPGHLERAAEMAYRDAYLTHRGNGIYGAMYFAAAIAAAFAVDDPMEALELGLAEIPARCRLAADLRWALDRAPRLRDWREARRLVDERFAGMHTVHTNNNACLTVFGLALGRGDFTRTIGITVAMGLDNDCTAATAGSLLGAALGVDGVPVHWWKPFRNRAKTYLNGVPELSIADLVKRFAAVAGVVTGNG